MAINCTRPGQRVGLALLFAAAAVAGCAHQPIGTFERAEFVARSAPDARYDFAFLIDSAEPAPGEVEGLAAFLRTLGLGPGDEVLLTFVSSGIVALDGARVGALGEAVRASGTPASVRVVNTRGFDRADAQSNVVLVEALSRGQILVACPGRYLDAYEQEYAAPVPRMGCANAANLAAMAARPSDLTQPRTLGPAEGSTSAAAVLRHRAGQINEPPSLYSGR